MNLKIEDFASNGKKSLLLFKGAVDLCVCNIAMLYLIVLRSVILNGTATPNTDTSTANICPNQRFFYTRPSH